jgi:hypothetical protein
MSWINDKSNLLYAEFQGLEIFTESFETKIASIKYILEEAEKTRMLEIE